MPRFRSLYSRYFSTIGASSLWALAVFWKRAESVTISGDDRALLSSSYFSSVWSRRSNMGSLHIVRKVSQVRCNPERAAMMPRKKPLPPPLNFELESQFLRRTPLGNHQFAAALFF